MKTLLKLFAAALLTFMIPSGTFAQKGHPHGNKKVIVKSPHKTVIVNNPHPHKHRHWRHRRVVYHPVWAPGFAYYHRWVFFPRYNFYWDNYNNVYVYWGAGAWIRTATPPPAVINININNEKKYELDKDDAIDDIYDNNETHKKEYPES